MYRDIIKMEMISTMTRKMVSLLLTEYIHYLIRYHPLMLLIKNRLDS